MEDSEKRRLLAPLLLAIFMRALPLTMFGPLLAGIARSLGAGLAEIGWIVATYATGSLIAQPVMGRLSDLRGRKRILIACVVLFGLGSIVCALATSLWVLVAGRIVQALGAGGIQPVVTAIVADHFAPGERGGPLGSVYGMYGLGTMAGALAGGAIVSAALWLSANASLGAGVSRELASFPWHLVFWVNVALALATLAATSALAPDEPSMHNGSDGFDYPGIVLVATFTASLMIAATATGIAAIAGLAGAAASLIALYFWEPRARAPLFDPALFRGRGPLLVYGIAFVFGLPSFSLTIYSATYLIAGFGASEAQSGLALFGLAAAYVAGAIAGGRATRTMGSKIPLIGGVLGTGAALASLAAFPSMPAVVASMVLAGLGLGIASAPPNALLLAYFRKAQTGGASGLALMLATSGSITAPALISAFIHHGGADAGVEFRQAFGVGAVLCAVCAALSTALPAPQREVG
ncbi:MAG: MFS transporter [Candidatus Eremiobacterales bacterium]